MNEIYQVTDSIIIAQTTAEHAKALELLQYIVFPTLAEDEILHEAHYLKHLTIFPGGPLVALDRQTVTGGATTMR